jgi:hypothetical protein
MRHLVTLTVHITTKGARTYYDASLFNRRFGNDRRSSQAHSLRGRKEVETLSLDFNIDGCAKTRGCRQHSWPHISQQKSVCLSVRPRLTGNSTRPKQSRLFRFVMTVHHKVRLLTSVALVTPWSSAPWPIAKWSPVAGNFALTLQLLAHSTASVATFLVAACPTSRVCSLKHKTQAAGAADCKHCASSSHWQKHRNEWSLL